MKKSGFLSVRIRHSAIAAFLLPFLLARAQAEPAMWVARTKDSTIYFIGTLHLLRRQAEWKTPKVIKALTASTELWLEVSDPENQGAALPLIQKYGYDREKTLLSRLTAVQKQKLTKIAGQYDVPLPTLEPMKPWLAAVLLAVVPLQKAGYDPGAGIDHSLKDEATKLGHKVYGFETQEDQVRFLAELPEADQIAFFDETLDDINRGIDLIDKLATAWLSGDSKAISHYFVEELKSKSPSIYRKLLVERNAGWADKVVEFSRSPGVKLVAVGAGHLVGPDSLQVQLGNKGITVEPY
jgi:uncharacterized protein YbaP (TraB family)